MKADIKNKCLRLLGVCLSCLMLWLAFLGVQWDELGLALSGVEWAYIAVATLLTFIELFFACYRWRVMLRPLGGCTLRECSSVFLINSLLNHVLPMRPGELARIFLICKHTGFSKMGVLASLVLEKLLDVMMLILIAWVLSIFVEWSQEYRTAGVFLAICCLVATYLIVLVVKERKIIRPEWIARVIPAPYVVVLTDKIRVLKTGFSSVKNQKDLFKLVLLTLLLWGTGILVTQMYIFSFGLNLPWYASSVILVLISLGSFIPSSPGGIGVLHYLYIVALGMFGVDKSVGLAFGIVTHALIYAANVFAGFAAMAWYGYSINGIKKLVKEGAKVNI